MALGISDGELLVLARLIAGHAELRSVSDMLAVDMHELETELLRMEYERRSDPLTV